MSTRGPMQVSSNGLVFYYDTFNEKSYKGQPTTNVAVNPLDLFAWCTSGANAATLARDTSTLPSPAGGIPMKMITSGNDAYTNTYNNSVWNLSAASSGQTWTVSVWAKANRNIANTTCELVIFEANSSGTYITVQSVGIYPTTEWQRFSYTLTLYSAATAYIQVRLDGPNAYTAGDVVWWDGLQVEQKSYPTQFAAGTRSVTNGLMDLTGNYTVDLTDMSFTSNAAITFDGTNDYINTNVGAQTLTNGTIEAWIYDTKNNSGYRAIVQFNVNSDDALYIYPANVLGFWPCAQATSITVPSNTWVHVVASFNGSQILYSVNGVMQTVSDSCSHFTDLQFLRIGGHGTGDGERWQGKIDMVKIYNRALSASEILRNYNATKSRYGL